MRIETKDFDKFIAQLMAVEILGIDYELKKETTSDSKQWAIIIQPSSTGAIQTEEVRKS